MVRKFHKPGNSCRVKPLLPTPRAAHQVRDIPVVSIPAATCSELGSCLQHDCIWTNSHLRTVGKKLIHEIQKLDETRFGKIPWSPGISSQTSVWVRQQNSQWYYDKAFTWDGRDPGSSSSSAAFREGFEPPLWHLGWVTWALNCGPREPERRLLSHKVEQHCERQISQQHPWDGGPLSNSDMTKIWLPPAPSKVSTAAPWKQPVFPCFEELSYFFFNFNIKWFPRVGKHFCSCSSPCASKDGYLSVPQTHFGQPPHF